MSSFKRSQAKYVKQTHKITNWPSYDRALVNRGSPSIRTFMRGFGEGAEYDVALGLAVKGGFTTMCVGSAAR